MDVLPALRHCDRTRLHYDTKREADKAAKKLGKLNARARRCRCGRWRVILPHEEEAL